MSNQYVPSGTPSALRPLLLLTFAATVAACSGGGGGEPGASDPDLADPASPDDATSPADPRGRTGAQEPDGLSGDDVVDADDPIVIADPPAVGGDEDEDPVAESSDAPVPAGWLYTDKNRIRRAGGGVWQGRGANIADTRGCNACGEAFQDADEVKRRIDALVDDWGATFVRLTLESAGESGILNDPAYLNQIEEIIDHIGSKPGVVVMLANWISPHHSEMGWPTAGTREEWRALAARFADDKHVMFGLVNEPEENSDGALDADVWEAMNATVAAIREVEAERGSPKHIIAVQGTGGWSRHLDYYVDHPITAGGGENIAYEVHVYDPASELQARFGDPSNTLPVIIGEFGPWDPYMDLQDTQELIRQADAKKVPWLAWTFHMRCPPNLIEDLSEGGCGIDMDLTPTPWGEQIKSALQD